MCAENQIIKSKENIYNFYREKKLSLHVFTKLLASYDGFSNASTLSTLKIRSEVKFFLSFNISKPCQVCLFAVRTQFLTFD